MLQVSSCSPLAPILMASHFSHYLPILSHTALHKNKIISPTDLAMLMLLPAFPTPSYSHSRPTPSCYRLISSKTASTPSFSASPPLSLTIQLFAVPHF